ncbi:DNA/RNA polymerase, partial [Sistotremastrum niveocremeum HHB9708]
MFTPGIRLTQERLDALKLNSDGFLLPDELTLLHHVLKTNELYFAWDESEKGKFKDSYFDPVIIPTIEHIPWQQKNIPIPPGILEDVIKIIRDKISTGVYEPSSSSYRSRIFCVIKKDGKSLRIVHDLQPQDAVTIRDAGVPPHILEIVEEFAGRSIYSLLDLFVGYD